jgi:hypothetical protein
MDSGLAVSRRPGMTPRCDKSALMKKVEDT